MGLQDMVGGRAHGPGAAHVERVIFRLAAAALISLAPQLLFFLFAQKYIIKGLTLGAVKG